MNLNKFYKIPKDERKLTDYEKLSNVDKQSVPMSALPVKQHPFTWPWYGFNASPVGLK